MVILASGAARSNTAQRPPEQSGYRDWTHSESSRDDGTGVGADVAEASSIAAELVA